MEFTFNKEGILSTLTDDHSVMLNEKTISWQAAEDVTVAFNNVLPPEGLPYSFVERPNGHTDAIYNIEDVRRFVTNAPIGSVYYILPDVVEKTIYLWVKGNSGWYPGAANLKVGGQRRKVNEPTKISSSELFNIIKETNRDRESFTILYQFRVEGRVELREKEITNYQELVDVIFNQDVISIKYFLARYHQILMVTYSRVDRDSWKRLI